MFSYIFQAMEIINQFWKRRCGFIKTGALLLFYSDGKGTFI